MQPVRLSEPFTFTREAHGLDEQTAFLILAIRIFYPPEVSEISETDVVEFFVDEKLIYRFPVRDDSDVSVFRSPGAVIVGPEDDFRIEITGVRPRCIALDALFSREKSE